MVRHKKIAILKPFGRTVSVSPAELELARLVVDAFSSGVIMTKAQILALANMSGAPRSRAYKLTRLARDVSEEPIYAMARDQYKNLRHDPLAWDRTNRAHINRAIGSLRAGVEYMLKLEAAIVTHEALSEPERVALGKALLGRRNQLGLQLTELHTALEKGPAALGPGDTAPPED